MSERTFDRMLKVGLVILPNICAFLAAGFMGVRFVLWADGQLHAQEPTYAPCILVYDGDTLPQSVDGQNARTYQIQESDGRKGMVIDLPLNVRLTVDTFSDGTCQASVHDKAQPIEADPQ